MSGSGSDNVHVGQAAATSCTTSRTTASRRRSTSRTSRFVSAQLCREIRLVWRWDSNSQSKCQWLARCDQQCCGCGKCVPAISVESRDAASSNLLKCMVCSRLCMVCSRCPPSRPHSFRRHLRGTVETRKCPSRLHSSAQLHAALLVCYRRVYG